MDVTPLTVGVVAPVEIKQWVWVVATLAPPVDFVWLPIGTVPDGSILLFLFNVVSDFFVGVAIEDEPYVSTQVRHVKDVHACHTGLPISLIERTVLAGFGLQTEVGV